MRLQILLMAVLMASCSASQRTARQDRKCREMLTKVAARCPSLLESKPDTIKEKEIDTFVKGEVDSAAIRALLREALKGDSAKVADLEKRLLDCAAMPKSGTVSKDGLTLSWQKGKGGVRFRGKKEKEVRPCPPSMTVLQPSPHKCPGCPPTEPNANWWAWTLGGLCVGQLARVAYRLRERA
jgi:hypothetical protein